MTTAPFPVRAALRLPRVGLERLASVRVARFELTAAALLALLYGTYSIRGQLLGTTHAFDLGIFTQGVRGYAEGTGPISSIKGSGFSLLGDHFSPVTALIAPFYAMFPTPITLLVAQALLIAVSAIPIVGLFREWFGRGVAVMAAGAYGLSFGVVNAVGYDFHEVAFAAPLMAFAVVALARRRPIAVVAWSAPLVLVKEDMGVTVAAIGVVLALVTRRWLLGAGLAAFGLLATVVEVKLLIPLFNPAGHYAYSGQIAGVHAALAALVTGADVKAATLACFVALSAIVGLRSPLMLIVVPTLGWRFISAIPNYWGITFHYGLLLMPVVLVAIADGIRRLRPAKHERALARACVGLSLAASLLLLPTTAFWTLLSPSAWQHTAATAAVQRGVRLIPDGATVAASGMVVPQIVTRTDAWLVWSPDALSRGPEWVVVDTVSSPGEFAPDEGGRAAFVVDAERRGWRPVFTEDGVFVLRR